MTDIKTREQQATDFEDYLADLLTSAIASDDDNPDIILRDEAGRVVYVDIEEQTMWIIPALQAEAKPRV